MNDEKIIRVVLAEDHVVVRQGLSALLDADGHFQVVGEATTGREAVQMAQQFHPDIILMDIAMPVLNGLEAMRQILSVNPAAKVIILSAHSEDEYIQRAHNAGAAGFIEKQISTKALIKAIREVATGNPFFSPLSDGQGDFPPAPRVQEPRLTRREAEVLQLVAGGSANKQIAATLGVSIKTVEKHRHQLMAKLDIHDIAGLTRYALSIGVVGLRPPSKTT